jgi:hypothetical protein
MRDGTVGSAGVIAAPDASVQAVNSKAATEHTIRKCFMISPLVGLTRLIPSQQKAQMRRISYQCIALACLRTRVTGLVKTVGYQTAFLSVVLDSEGLNNEGMRFEARGGYASSSTRRPDLNRSARAETSRDAG